MPYTILLEILLSIASKSYQVLKKHWKPIICVMVLAVMYFYVTNLREDLSDMTNKFKQSEANHTTYVKEQAEIKSKLDSKVASLTKSSLEKSKELSREITIRNETIARITDSNSSLVSRLQQQSEANTLYYKSVPNIDTSLLSKYKSLSKSFNECTGEVAELAAESDRLSTIITSIETSVGGFNKEVESLNQP